MTLQCVPVEHLPSIKAKLKTISDAGERLEFNLEKLKEEAMKLAAPLDTKTLPHGKRFGVLTYSPMAYAKRNGKCEMSGDVYLVVWTWIEDGTFALENAWGGVILSQNPAGPGPLIALD